MNFSEWSERADYLKKRYDYARHVGSGQAEAWRLNLLQHLATEPVAEPSTPLPQIEASTVDKFGDGWIEWKGGERPVDAEQMIEIRTRAGFLNIARARFFRWDVSCLPTDIIAYRIVKD